MGEMILETDFMMQVLSGLIIAAIVGAFSFSFILYKCVHKQGIELKKTKIAFAVVVRLFVTETKRLHPNESEEILEIEKIYKELIDDN